MTRPSLALAVLALLAAACGSEDPAGTAPPQLDPAAAAALAPFWSATEPAGAVDVLGLRELESGSDVVVRGDVQDFPVAGRALFTLVDFSLTSCDEMEMDSCKTPWDFCCVEKPVLARATATVELQEDGEPVAADVQGFHGIDHLTDVVVAGTLQVDDAGNLRVIGKALHAR